MDVSTVKKPSVQPAQQTKRIEPIRHVQTSEAKAKSTESPKVAQAKPNPVVNTQGHTTGRLLNVSA